MPIANQEKNARALNLLSSDHAILLRLHATQGRPATVTQLAKDLQLSVTRVSMALSRLEQRGCVLRTFPLRDNRTVQASLTSHGRESAEELVSALASLVTALRPPVAL